MVLDGNAVRSVDRAAALLLALGDSQGEAGVTELARRLGLHKSTASRLLATLQKRGLVEQDDETGKYRLGLVVIRLAERAERTLDLRGIATPELAFQVYVRVKRQLNDLHPDDRIPERVQGFPADVILIEESSLLQLPDEEEYRPLCGGSQLDQGVGSGTLGVIAEATAGSLAPVGARVILTNHHVAPTIGAWVGQPSAPSDCHCCACCDVGRVVDSRLTNLVDGAIATVSAGVRWSHEILERGAVRGSVSATTMTPGDPVWKRGRTTGLTRGIFSTASRPRFTVTENGQVYGTFDQQIRITAAVPGQPFALKGDSGSVVVDAQNRVIGLLFLSVIPAGTPATANRIEHVASTLNISIPVMGTAGAAHLSGAGIRSPHPAAVRAAWAALAERVQQTPQGRAWWRLVAHHYDEVRRLVRTQRETKVAWQRYGGPSFLAHYLKTATDRTYRAPDEVQGMRLENALLGMAAVLQQHGSAELSRDVAGHYLRVMELAAPCRRADELVERARTAGPAGETEPEEDAVPAAAGH